MPLERFLLPPEQDGSHGTPESRQEQQPRLRYRAEAKRWGSGRLCEAQGAVEPRHDDARDYINGVLIDPQPARRAPRIAAI